MSELSTVRLHPAFRKPVYVRLGRSEQVGDAPLYIPRFRGNTEDAFSRFEACSVFPSFSRDSLNVQVTGAAEHLLQGAVP